MPNARRTIWWTILRIKHKVPFFHNKCLNVDKKGRKLICTSDTYVEPIEIVKKKPIQKNYFLIIVVILPFYPDSIVSASLHIPESFSSYFYHVWFSKKMLSHFHASWDKKERDNASVSRGKQVHASSLRERPCHATRKQNQNTNISSGLNATVDYIISYQVCLI